MTTEEAAKDEKILGVKISRVHEASLRESFERAIGKAPGSKKTVPQIVEELAAHFLKKKKEGLLECDVCLGGSPKTWEGACPFCGTTDDGPPPEVVQTSIEVRPPPTESKASKRKLADAPDANGSNGHAIVPAKVEVVGSVADLDAAVARMKAVRNQTAARGMWLMGREVLEIYDRELWRQRNGPDGKPLYKTFEQFVNAELEGLHHKTVFKMMRVAKDFTEEQLAQYGASIIKGLLGAPKEARQEILEKVDKGEVKGSRGVLAEVAEIRQRAGISSVEGVGKGKGRGKASVVGSSAAAKKRAEARKNVVTVPFPAGRQFLQALAKQASKKDEPKAAKRLADQPWARLECSNGVTVYVSIVERGGKLGFSIEARREE